MSHTPSFAKQAVALVFASTLLGTAPLVPAAQAAGQELHGVANIDVWATPPVPEVVVRNIAGNHHIDSLNLAVQGNTIAVAVGGYVDCTGTQFENFAQRFGHYLSSAAFGIGRTSLIVGKALPDSTSIDRDSAMGADTFQLPVAKLADPQIAVDPVAVVLAAANAAPNKVHWLRQDHVLTVKIPVRWEAGCAFYTRNKITKQTVKEAAQPSYLTKEIDLKVRYQGDPQLFAVNAQIGQANQGGGFQAGPQPFKITSMTFQPNMPHHVGACPDTTTIRVFFQGQGKGALRIRINEGGTTIHNSAQLPFDAKNGVHHYDFEIETPKAAPADLNKTFAHDLRLFFRGKGEEQATWPAHYTPMDAKFWNHRCTPTVNPVIGGGVGGKAPGFQSGGAAGPARAPLKVLPPAQAPGRPARQVTQ